MAQEMYKHDAMLHIVWSVATIDKKSGEEKTVTPEEDNYLILNQEVLFLNLALLGGTKHAKQVCLLFY